MYCLLYTLCLLQLSVACNLIPEGVRMRIRRWIISHRCSRMAIYVFCCNARISFHSVYSKGLVQETLFVNCPSVICLPSMLSLWGDTTSELWTPILLFPLLNNHNSSSVYFSAIYFTAKNSSSTQYG